MLEVWNYVDFIEVPEILSVVKYIVIEFISSDFTNGLSLSFA